MMIKSAKVYQDLFDYTPETGALLFKGTEDSAVQYRKHNRAVVIVDGEEQPAAVVAWVMMGNRWSYDLMIISLDKDLGNICADNLVPITKAEYERERGFNPFGNVIAELLAFCTLGISGKMEQATCLTSIQAGLRQIQTDSRRRK